MTNLSGANLNNFAAVGPQGECRDSPSRFPAYPTYRNSGVEWLGVVPEHWALGSLKHLAWIRNGRDYKDVESPDGEYPVIGSGGQFANATRYLYDGESVLLGRKGTIDKPLYIHGRFWTVDTMFYTEVTSGASAKFLYYNALTIPFQYYSTSTALPSMTQGDLLNHPCAIPALEEQTQIARCLDHETVRIDALIEEQQRLIELLREKRQAVISRAVTKGLDPTVPMKDSGVKWLGEVPEHWEVTRLGQNIQTRKGVAFSAVDFADEGVPVVKASDIKNHSINEPSTFISYEFLKKTPNAILKKGNLVLSTVGSTPDVKNSAVGQIGCVPEYLDGVLLNQNTVIFEPNNSRVSSEYLFFVLLTTAYRDHLDLNAHGTANQASLSLADMLSFCIPLPDLDEQKAISSALSRVLENVKALERESESLVGLLTERRSALISAAVTGKIDVRGWQPPADASVFGAEARSTNIEAIA